MRDKPKTRETKIFHVFTKLNMKEAMDHLAEHGSFNILDMTKEPSLARIIRNYSNHSLNENANEPLPAAHTEELDKQDTILDMAAVEAKYSKKMADDSKIHHILDDAMFVPRRRFSTSQKHVLPDLNNHPPFKHHIRKEIRRLASISKDRAKTTKSLTRYEPNHPRHIDSPRPHKNVSFSRSAPPGKDKHQLHASFSDGESQNEDEDVGIVFTARQSSVESDTTDAPDKLNVRALDKTAVEKQLPWRRLTSRDERPNLSEAPSWANNLAYHGLTESGSPYSSPHNTIQKEGETTPPTVFSVFPRIKSEDTDSAVAMSIECLNVCPATGEPSSKEVATDKPSNGIHVRSRRDGNRAPPGDAHTRHRDSGVIDSDENCDSLPKTLKTVENGNSLFEASPPIFIVNTQDIADTTEETKL